MKFERSLRISTNMWKYFLLLTIFWAYLVDPVNGVLGGVAVSPPNSRPYIVQVHAMIGGRLSIHGGIIFDEYTILTAGLNVSAVVKIVAGKQYLDKTEPGSQERTICDFSLHPNLGGSIEIGFGFDFCVLHLKDKLTFNDKIQPLGLIPFGEKGTECFMIGWGKIAAGAGIGVGLPEQLSQKAIDFSNPGQCPLQHETILCVAGACELDLGSAVVCKNKGKHCLSAYVSLPSLTCGFSTACNLAFFPFQWFFGILQLILGKCRPLLPPIPCPPIFFPPILCVPIPPIVFPPIVFPPIPFPGIPGVPGLPPFQCPPIPIPPFPPIPFPPFNIPPIVIPPIPCLPTQPPLIIPIPGINIPPVPSPPIPLIPPFPIPSIPVPPILGVPVPPIGVSPIKVTPSAPLLPIGIPPLDWGKLAPTPIPAIPPIPAGPIVFPSIEKPFVEFLPLPVPPFTISPVNFVPPIGFPSPIPPLTIPPIVIPPINIPNIFCPPIPCPPVPWIPPPDPILPPIGPSGGTTPPPGPGPRPPPSDGDCCDKPNMQFGNPVIPHSRPYIVQAIDRQKQIYTGVILNHYTILVPAAKAKDITHVIAGKHSLGNFESTQQMRTVCMATAHPNYNTPENAFGYGLIQLSDPLVYNEFVNAIKLAPKGDTPNSACTMVTWRGTDTKNVLLEQIVTFKDANSCSSKHETISCVEPGSCLHNWGSPVICTKNSNIWVQAITSSTSAYCKSGILTAIPALPSDWLMGELTKGENSCGKST